MDALGEIKTPMEDFDFEDAIGDDARQIRQASFLGSSITSRRTRVGGIIAVLVFGLFVSRAAYLQILNGSYFFGLAEGTHCGRSRTYHG